MTAAVSTANESPSPAFRAGSRSGVVVSLIMLVLAFTFAVTFPFRTVTAMGTPASLEMTAEVHGQLPTDQPDYGLAEHGAHCLGHAVVRAPVAFVEPMPIPRVAGSITNQQPPVAANLSPPDKPPRD